MKPATKREVWVAVDRYGAPIFSVGQRTVYAYVEPDEAEYLVGHHDLVRYVPAPAPRKRRKR